MLMIHQCTTNEMINKIRDCGYLCRERKEIFWGGYDEASLYM